MSAQRLRKSISQNRDPHKLGGRSHVTSYFKPNNISQPLQTCTSSDLSNNPPSLSYDMADKRPSSSSPAVSHDENVEKITLRKAGESSDSDGPYAEHGAGIDHKIPQDDVLQAEPRLLWSQIRHVMREPFSEFFGVFILILFGDGWEILPRLCYMPLTRSQSRCSSHAQRRREGFIPINIVGLGVRHHASALLILRPILMRFSLGVMLGVYASGASCHARTYEAVLMILQISGAHINPAVTFANW